MYGRLAGQEALIQPETRPQAPSLAHAAAILSPNYNIATAIVPFAIQEQLP